MRLSPLSAPQKILSRSLSTWWTVFTRAGWNVLWSFILKQDMPPSEMLEIIKYWKREYHIDGFHLMGKGICPELFMKDPYLSGTKLFFHDVDGERILGGTKTIL